MHEIIQTVGYVFPNDRVWWSLMIVTYPYITGLIAGAFIVSSLYHVFGIKTLQPVARFSLIFALSFWFFCTVPLLNHLGRPDRAFNIMLTPHPSSAMAGFGFVYSLYGIVLILEILFLYRPILVQLMENSTGIKKTIYKILTLGVYDTSQETLKYEHKVTSFLAAIGIPLACTLHGYAGFIFGGVKAVHWWFTPLMPVIFLLSASVSGIAGIILFYLIIAKYRKMEIDEKCMKTLVKFLWGFVIADLVTEMLDVGVHAYLRVESWHIIEKLLNEHLFFSFWILQVLIGGIFPLIILGWLSISKKVSKTTLNFWAGLISFILLIQVYAMRWNVVVGGQMVSKSGRGFVFYHPHFFEKEGILPVLILLALPVVTLYILSKIFPLWENEKIKEV